MSYLTDMEDFQDDEFGPWAYRTFPNATPQTILAHLKREIKELELALTYQYPADKEIEHEVADCALLLMDMANRYGFSLQRVMKEKFRVLKDRKWGEPDAEGVVEHVRS